MSAPAKGDPRVLIETLAKVLVEAPNEVVVDVEEEGETTYVNLEVAESDMGRIIGRQGRTAKSLRSILNAAGIRHKKHYELEILD
jgi:uncharacterized protein